MGGLKGSGCRWLWGMKSLNRSLTSPTEPLPINWPWGGKKFTSTLRPSREVSGESRVTHPDWHAGGCECVWAVGMSGCMPPILKKGIHKGWATQTPYCAYVTVHTWQYVHSCHPHAHKHTLPPSPACSPPYPLPLTLPHTHKIRLNYPGVLSPTCLLVLLFLQREHFFFFAALL